MTASTLQGQTIDQVNGLITKFLSYLDTEKQKTAELISRINRCREMGLSDQDEFSELQKLERSWIAQRLLLEWEVKICRSRTVTESGHRFCYPELNDLDRRMALASREVEKLRDSIPIQTLENRRRCLIM